MKYYALFGSPASQSLSPALWNSYAKQNSMAMKYLLINPVKSSNILPAFKALDLSGANITAPFKEELFSVLDAVDDAAQKIGAVNTLVQTSSGVKGYNSDWLGVLYSLEACNVNLTSLSVLLLGAGGAAKAALYALEQAKVKSVTVYNRSNSKLQALCEQFTPDGLTRSLPSLEDLSAYGMVINTLPASATLVDSLKDAYSGIWFDAAYGNVKRAPKAQTYIEGEQWLVNQARECAALWFGDADYAQVLKAWKSRVHHEEGNCISLIGFMGAGKTSLGKSLAKSLKRNFYDTDALLEAAAGCSISQLFDEDGEAGFRKREAQIIRDLSLYSASVLSCGGGAVLNEENKRFLREHSYLVWIYRDMHETLDSAEMTQRPLLSAYTDAAAQLKVAKGLFEKRKQAYLSAAQYILINRNISETELVETAVSDFQKYLNE